MARLILQRLLQMLLIMALTSLTLFAIFDSDRFRLQIANAELGNFGLATMSEADYQAWLERKGLNVPFHERYLDWLGGLASGDLGQSFEKNTEVAALLGERLANTAVLAAVVFALMVPLALGLGILAGIREGSRRDRAISILCVGTTSFPEIATAIVLTVVFALGLGWLPAKSAMVQGWDWRQLVLPAATLVLYDFGYVARMTRASMIEVMTTPYIRSAILKGLPYRRVVLRHALRNAMIAPFTVIVLQLNWLLSGVVVVEVFFDYAGFGKLLLDAALFGDIYVIQAATLVAVGVAVVSQIVSDIGYILLNPRIRFA